MNRFALSAISAALLLSACAGVDVTPISPTLRAGLHGSADAEKFANRGYVVYEPMLLVSVAPGKKCLGQAKDGKCLGTSQDVCEISEPKLLPNYNRPYLVKSRSGFGKAGTQIDIKDGWMLSSIKDESDNSAILAALLGKEKLAASAMGGEAAPVPGCAIGVYTVPSACDPSKPGTCQLQPWRLDFK